MSKSRFIVWCLAIVLVYTGGRAVSQETVSVSRVTVWVKAEDKSGAPVRGLTADNFEIYEDGKQQSITCFEEVGTEVAQTVPAATPQPIAGEAAEQGASSGKRFVLFLDLLNIAPAEYGLIRPRITEFLQQIGGKNHEVMLAALLPNSKLGIIARYTKETQKITELIEHAPANPMRDNEIRGNETNIINVLEQLRPETDRAVESLEDIANSASPTVQFNTNIMKNAYQLAQNFAAQESSRSRLVLNALESFAGYLAQQSAFDHTVVLFVSGGFTSDPGRRYYDLIDRVLDQKGLTSQDSFVNAVRVPNSKRDLKFDMPDLVRRTIGRLNKLNLTLYAINTRGLAALRDNTAQSADLATDNSSVVPDYINSLRQVADETGGLSFQNSQNFQVGFDKIFADLDHQYMICYNVPQHKKQDYHKIKVVSKQSDIKLRHRAGYFD